MSRAFLFIMDGFGIGHAPDAAAFGDEGSNTFGHVWEQAKPNIPTLARLGLGAAAEVAGGTNPFAATQVIGRYGAASEVSKGKDSVTGHWEIAGVPLTKDWGYFPHHRSGLSTRFHGCIDRTGKVARAFVHGPCFGHTGDSGFW